MEGGAVTGTMGGGRRYSLGPGWMEEVFLGHWMGGGHIPRNLSGGLGIHLTLDEHGSILWDRGWRDSKLHGTWMERGCVSLGLECTEGIFPGIWMEGGGIPRTVDGAQGYFLVLNGGNMSSLDPEWTEQECPGPWME